MSGSNIFLQTWNLDAPRQEFVRSARKGRNMPRSKGKGLPKKAQEDQDSWIMRVRVDLIPPSLKDNTADAERLTKGLKKALHHRDVIIDFSLLNCLTSRLRENHYQVDALVFETGKRWHVMDSIISSITSLYFSDVFPINKLIIWLFSL